MFHGDMSPACSAHQSIKDVNVNNTVALAGLLKGTTELRLQTHTVGGELLYADQMAEQLKFSQNFRMQKLCLLQSQAQFIKDY